jgi:dethiobiotin synthetase
VVARAGLGTVNHTGLTVGAARALGLTVAGVVLNGDRDSSSPDNAAMIEQFAEVPVLGWTPRIEGELTGGRLRALVEDHLPVAALAAAAGA